jgi:demethylmenaquinone methyltransferase/2-methoxy-6-polyprenyl-1,4-benzoquinol methylase
MVAGDGGFMLLPARGSPSDAVRSPSVDAGTGTEEYYHRRAPDYDDVYFRPERQADLLTVRTRLTDLFAGKRVLEVAAGTGWWTNVLADTAASVTATDVNRATLDVASARRAWPPSVEFVIADAFQLQAIRGNFDAAFAGFFWSHVPLEKLDAFLDDLMPRLLPGSLMVFIDNRLVPGSVHPVARRDEQGNTYQKRQLKDESSWDVLKNFPQPDEVRTRLSRIGSAVEVQELDNYWLAWCRTPTAAP